MRHQRLRPVRTSFQPEAEEDACRDLPRACVRSAAGHRVMSRQHSQTSKCGALAWVRCHSVQGQGLSAQASEASELAWARVAGLPAARSPWRAQAHRRCGKAAVGTALPAAPVRKRRWGQPALSTTASSHTPWATVGAASPSGPPFGGWRGVRGRFPHSSCPRGWGPGRALLITGPGPQSEMLSFQQGGDSEVPDGALFLGLDSEEVPLGLGRRGVKWGQERSPRGCGAQEGLGEAGARGRSTRGRPGAGAPQPSLLWKSPGRCDLR